MVWVILLLFGVSRQVGWPDFELLFRTVVVAAVLEETVFRGLLQASLFDKPRMRGFIWARISYANLVTSIIFAAFHLFTQPPLWAMSVIVPSLVFGWARDRTQSVIPSMVLHAWYNLGFILLFVR